MNSPFLEAACKWAMDGFPIFPAQNKRPLCPHGFKDATMDARTILSWWTEHPNAQIAIPTGSPSRLFVVDVDGSEGQTVVEKLALPPTRTVETSPGRLQLWYTQPDGVTTKSTAGVLGLRLDTRGDGGYVIVPPSVHHASGKPYRFVNDLPQAPMPEFLISYKPNPRPEIPLYDVIPEGRRNVELTSLAGRWRAQGHDRDQLFVLLQDSNRRRCHPPLPDRELQTIASSIGAKPTHLDYAEGDEDRTCASEVLPDFPEAAWRGCFDKYRRIMRRSTEASDVFHFAALWARSAVALGRRVYFNYGMPLYPNAYLVCFGSTGDRKTTATRFATHLGGEFAIIRGGGSGEGIADDFSKATPAEGLLLYAEEFSQILRVGQWTAATLIPFLTQCFDCPDLFELKFRKTPIAVDRPTPVLLAGTTPDWFWQDFRARDFQGGFGNRLFFLSGARKESIAIPEAPVLEPVSTAVQGLERLDQCEARLEGKAAQRWREFYGAWNGNRSRIDPLLVAATERIPPYVLKLAMVYAALEQTLPQIELDQLDAAILVAQYGERCAAELLALQHSATNPRKELERRILAFVNSTLTTKRRIYRSLQRHYADAEAFNRAFDSLVRAGELFTKPAIHGRIYVSRNPF